MMVYSICLGVYDFGKYLRSVSLLSVTLSM